MQKIVVAMVGQPLAGKDYLQLAIKKYCGEEKVACHNTGDSVRAILADMGLPQDRATCSKFIQSVVKNWGGSILTKAMQAKIAEDPRPVHVFNAMRLPSDEAMVHSLPYKTITVYVTAPPEERYRRLSARQRAGEAIMTYDQFLANESLPTERAIREIGERAFMRLESVGTPEQLDAQKLHFCKTHLHQYMA